MQLRRFTADSTPAALSAVRLALGDDAIILANRRLGDQVEIIATGQIDDAATLAEKSESQLAQSDMASAPSLENAPKSQTENDFSMQLAEAKQESKGSLFGRFSGKKSSTKSNDSVTSQEERPSDQLADDVVNISALSAEIASDGHQGEPLPPLGEKPAAVNTKSSQTSPAYTLGQSMFGLTHENPTAQIGAMEQLLAAFEEQKQAIDDRFKGLEVNLWGCSSPNRTRHFQQLLSLGVGAELAIRLVERADPVTPPEEAIRQSFALLKSTLPIGSDKTLSSAGVTVLSGAPGSGKTTALVKLATEHVKQSGNQSIVIICADTRRIGAFEELQAYGRLLGVPTVHAHDTAELASLINAFKHKQLVLIDHTLPNDAESIALPDSILPSAKSDSVRHLFTLPATTQASTAESLIAKHCAGQDIQCVLTHLDSNARLGELFSSIIRHHLPVAYWSDSASVQRPLQKADASVLIATAVAMSKRTNLSSDDLWLQRLIQPSHTLLSTNTFSADSSSRQEI